MPPMSHHQMVASVNRLLRERDYNGLLQLVHDDFVFETPQSRERWNR
jgi:ketosteroid isomerase-like protein